MKYFVVSLFFIQINLLSQSLPPKREFRGVWIATVRNLDWPSSNNLTTTEQKAQLISILDSLKTVGINAVIFQVRSEYDAMYNSSIEPWSYWLTGAQGKPPNPFYDPLQFVIKEAHKRGMELQAWFNPYRAVITNSAYKAAQNHVTVNHPDWVVTYGDSKILNPGLPQVRNYVVSVIMDVVRRYDIDGVHLDDYFYPYPKGNLAFNDEAVFKKYHYGFTDKDDWRRNNVNLLIKMVHDSIQAVKPYVKFGVSPFGIWKSGVPPGITGFSSYNKIYSDGVYWLKNHLIDYIAPQLYWSFGGKQDYEKLMQWWASKTYGRHLYVGLAAFKINSLGVSELLNQIRTGRNNSDVEGNILFRSLDGVLDNQHGFADSLKKNLYRYPALLPVMMWKDSISPNPPVNLRYRTIAANNKIELDWDPPAPAIDGDTAFRYVVYKFMGIPHSGGLHGYAKRSTINQDDLTAAHITAVEGTNKSDAAIFSDEDQYFVVTALDRLSNESAMSNVVRVKAFPVFTFVNLNPFNIKLNCDYTNPFNSAMQITFELTKDAYAMLKVFDLFGREVISPVNKYFSAGKNTITFQTNNLSTGVYVIKLYSGWKISYDKMILFNQ
ncbi:MAG: glycoside hydrolase family 10 protein [Ignavibacteriaceae bacterium]